VAIFSIAEAMLAYISLTYALVVYGINVSSTIVLIALHVAMIGCSILYLLVATKMAWRDSLAARWSVMLVDDDDVSPFSHRFQLLSRVSYYWRPLLSKD